MPPIVRKPNTGFHSEKVFFKCAHDLLQVIRNFDLGILQGRVIHISKNDDDLLGSEPTY